MTTQTGAPAPSAPAGPLSLDQGAAAIDDFIRGPDRDRDERTGRFRARDQARNPDGSEQSQYDDAWDDPDDEEQADDGFGDEFADDEASLQDEDADPDAPDADSDEEQPREAKFKVLVDGQEAEVTTSELIAGYQRGADYTRKTQALAEDRRRVEAVAQQAQTERAAYTQLLGQVSEFLMSQAPAEDVVNTLMMQDPVEGFRAKNVRDQILAKAQEFGAAYQAMVQGSRQQLAQEHRAEMAAAIQALPELIPEWKDPQRMQKERAAVGEAMVKNWGFRQEELDMITDPRAMLVARKAYLWDQLQARKGQSLRPKPAQRGPQTMRPGPKQPIAPNGARQPQRSQARVDRLTERARNTGDIRDVAALIFETEFTPQSRSRR